MIIDARKEFRESESGKRWHQASAESWFQEGVRVALQTMSFPSSQDMGTAAANWHRTEGARTLAVTLCNLTETPQPKQLDQTSNLRHTT